MLSTKLIIDIVFVTSVVIAVVLTAVILIRVLPDYLPVAVQRSAMVTDDSDGLMSGGQNTEQSTAREYEEFAGSLSEAPDPRTAIVTTDSIQAPDLLQASSPLILPITWGAVIGTLIWRGKVRSQWRREGYDYDTFRLVAKMRGSSTRIELLHAIADMPKNKLQLAKELGVDWKTIDNHVEMLLKNGLVEEKMLIGTSRYYGVTKDASKILLLLSSDNSDQDRQGNIQNDISHDTTNYVPDAKK